MLLQKFWNGELQKTTPMTKLRPISIYAGIDWQQTDGSEHIGAEFESSSFPWGFQSTPLEIAGQYLLTEQPPFLAPPSLRYMEAQEAEWQ